MKSKFIDGIIHDTRAFYFIFRIIYLFLATPGLHRLARASSSCGQVGAPLHRGTRASRSAGVSCWGTPALGSLTSAAAARRLRRGGLWAPGSVDVSSCGTQAQELRHTGLAAPRHVESSQAGDRTHVPCTGKQILVHWATREVPHFLKIMNIMP